MVRSMNCLLEHWQANVSKNSTFALKDPVCVFSLFFFSSELGDSIECLFLMRHINNKGRRHWHKQQAQNQHKNDSEKYSKTEWKN